jgi:hypothetical protein
MKSKIAGTMNDRLFTEESIFLAMAPLHLEMAPVVMNYMVVSTKTRG